MTTWNAEPAAVQARSITRAVRSSDGSARWKAKCSTASAPIIITGKPSSKTTADRGSARRIHSERGMRSPRTAVAIWTQHDWTGLNQSTFSFAKPVTAYRMQRMARNAKTSRSSQWRMDVVPSSPAFSVVMPVQCSKQRRHWGGGNGDIVTASSSRTWLDCEPCAHSTTMALMLRRTSQRGDAREAWTPTIEAASGAVIRR